MRIERGFAAIDEGQVHYREAGMQHRGGKPTMVMFHGSPLSSLILVPLIEHIAEDRHVIAFDTLGQGDSCAARSQKPEILEIAEGMARAYDALGYGDAEVDAFGTHTGARIAIEWSLLGQRQRVRRLVLDGMGISDNNFYEEYSRSVDRSGFIDLDGTQFTKVFNVTRDMYMFWPPYNKTLAGMRHVGLPSADALHDEVVEILKAVRTNHRAYQAALRYPARARLGQVTVPMLVTCARGDMPYPFLDRVAQAVPHAVKKEQPQTNPIGLLTGEEAMGLATMMTEWLDGPAVGKT